MDKEIYLCDGKMPCAYRADGRKNEFCYIWGMGHGDWCKHTTDIGHAKNKKPVDIFGGLNNEQS